VNKQGVTTTADRLERSPQLSQFAFTANDGRLLRHAILGQVPLTERVGSRRVRVRSQGRCRALYALRLTF
jgi:hypothetical protein